MKSYRLFMVIGGALLAGMAAGPTPQGSSLAKAPEVLQLSGDTQGVHDPVIAKEGDTYYFFCTGGGRGGR